MLLTSASCGHSTGFHRVVDPSSPAGRRRRTARPCPARPRRRRVGLAHRDVPPCGQRQGVFLSIDGTSKELQSALICDHCSFDL
ncbi:hypothetical protein BRADI_2g06666v3 [Brachypodium distachyon]|uniref:Uncharacterized protein n=1 Tax=Brachypodium distachyon TaxID=15368 RepID=A0A0Q3IBL8_BRADI|nr:hypothetical protein BRADI_2g06666v3 [Brachypodium distachyon]